MNTYCLYTTQVGGRFKTIRCTEEEYDDWEANRRIWYWGDRDPDAEGAEPFEVTPFYMALVRVEKDFDFGLGRSRIPVEGASA